MLLAALLSFPTRRYAAIPRKAQPAALPLTGKRVLVGRAKHQASALSELLRAQGAGVLEVPFIEIRPPESWAPLDDAIGRLLDYDWLILTSANGVQAFFNRLAARGGSEADLLHLQIAAIGPATRTLIERHGLPVDVVPERYVAEEVVEVLRPQMKKQRVLLVRAKVARDVIPAQLREAGAHVDVVEAYETVLPEESRGIVRAALDDPDGRPHVITFTSSSTARNFADLLGHTMVISGVLNGIKLASIGPVTSVTMRELGLRVDIEAKEYTMPGLVQAIVEAVH